MAEVTLYKHNKHPCAGSRSSKLNVKYFKTGDRYGDGVNKSLIKNHSWAIDWHHDHSSWLTLNTLMSYFQGH